MRGHGPERAAAQMADDVRVIRDDLADRAEVRRAVVKTSGLRVDRSQTAIHGGAAVTGGEPAFSDGTARRSFLV
jgi:hypothetical protein